MKTLTEHQKALLVIPTYEFQASCLLDMAIDENIPELVLSVLNNIINADCYCLNDSQKNFYIRFKMTLEYAQHHNDNPNASRNAEIDNYSLGSWQHNQRQKMRKNMLQPNHIGLLTKIGFIWYPQHGGHNKGH